MGSLKKLWGWYPTGEKWVKLQVDSTGKVLLSSIQAKARAYRSVNQLNLTHAVWTKVLLDRKSYDPGSNFDTTTNRFTAPITGYYAACAHVLWTETTVIADKRYMIAIYANGDTWKVIHYAHASCVRSFSNMILDIIYLEAGDYVELMARQESGVNTVDISGVSNYTTYMSIHLLSV